MKFLSFFKSKKNKTPTKSFLCNPIETLSSSPEALSFRHLVLDTVPDSDPSAAVLRSDSFSFRMSSGSDKLSYGDMVNDKPDSNASLAAVESRWLPFHCMVNDNKPELLPSMVALEPNGGMVNLHAKPFMVAMEPDGGSVNDEIQDSNQSTLALRQHSFSFRGKVRDNVPVAMEVDKFSNGGIAVDNIPGSPVALELNRFSMDMANDSKSNRFFVEQQESSSIMPPTAENLSVGDIPDSDISLITVKSRRQVVEPDESSSILSPETQIAEAGDPFFWDFKESLRSRRISFEAGLSSSILAAAKEFEPMTVESEDPCSVFRTSMELVADDLGLNDFRSLEGLFLWYLRMNEEENHGHIMRAFVDLCVQRANSSWAFSSSYWSSDASDSSSL
ncbi:hypothetical protein RJ639_039901 [Escallonia herrerae]|uniref:Transcription repressor n=1 Tax=Escallonia herrerae TaxID=1293975 RepID=A0AA89B932_9ASTE|nr:hypothetical protein RJ639_039901 [Escallonia herrerae]